MILTLLPLAVSGRLTGLPALPIVLVILVVTSSVS